MAKTPMLGLVKTRLGRHIGPAAATRIYRTTANAVLARLISDRRFQTSLAIAPDHGLATRAFDPRLSRTPQGKGDIGERMLRAADHASPGPVLIVGTDIPAIRPLILVRAIHALGSHDVVIGPAKDGGFWLIGFRRRPRALRCFNNVRWSHPDTLADVRRNLAGSKVAIVDTLSDMDGVDDIRRLGRFIGRRVVAPYA